MKKKVEEVQYSNMIYNLHLCQKPNIYSNNILTFQLQKCIDKNMEFVKYYNKYTYSPVFQKSIQLPCCLYHMYLYTERKNRKKPCFSFYRLQSQTDNEPGNMFLKVYINLAHTHKCIAGPIH